jgi:hypothetical protein
MSETVRIALVAEGVTDYEVLRAAMESMLNGRSFDLKLLQPDGSVAFIGGGDAGPLGGGWKGVYKWCLQAAQRGGGNLRGDPLFISYDLLVLHLDADVANEDPANQTVDPIPGLAGILPCAHDCPPPSATTDSLRRVLLSWVGETQTPPRTILCTPSKSTEAWVMAVFFPNDRDMVRQGWECHPDPESRLGQQPAGQRFSKRQADYQLRQADLQAGWPKIAERLSEALRFRDDFVTAVQQLPIMQDEPKSQEIMVAG